MVVLAGSPIQLDSTAPDWGAGSSSYDLEGGGSLAQLIFDNSAFLVQPGVPASYSTCADATNYTSSLSLDWQDITTELGAHYCAITNDHRFSLITLEAYSSATTPTPSSVAITVDIITWGPQTASLLVNYGDERTN
jgi:hypothetical protein